MSQTQPPALALFEPLVAALTTGRYLRVVARPGWVTGDLPLGPCLPLPDTAWSAEQHAQAWAACRTPIIVGDGVHALATGDGIVLSWVPKAFVPADLVREQVISPLAMRLVSAALALGRNVLVTGAYNAALPLIYAFVGEGARPAMLGGPHLAIPRRWLRLQTLAEAHTAHADRIGICATSAGTMVEMLGGLCGVVAFCPSRRLDQALMRYELGAAQLGARLQAPLHVLAGVDLVVQTSFQGTGHVTQIAEIALTDSGYRPQILFSSGLPPTPQALVPQAPPSFIYELALAGHVGLAEELSQLAPAPASPPAASASAPNTSTVPSRPAERPVRPPPMRPWQPPRPSPKHIDMTPPDSLPGWELDRLPAPEAEVGMQGVASAEDAMLAATYGLAPPPRPGAARAPRSFDETMLRVQSPPPVVPAADDVEDVTDGLPYTPPVDPEDP